MVNFSSLARKTYRPVRRYRKWRMGCYGAVFLLIVWSVAIEPSLLYERVLVLNDTGWRGAPLKVAFVADLHVGAPHVGLEDIKALVERINAARPDLILLGGDFAVAFVVGDKQIPPAGIAARLGRLSAPLGVFAVLGNHDWWTDGETVREALGANGIRVLENQAVVLREGLDRFSLIGVGDDMTGHARPLAAFAAAPADLPALVLMHDPANHPDLVRPAVLVLAGHTHAGQVRLPFVGALVVPGRFSRMRAYGLMRDTGSPLYVTSGVGTSVLPVRLFAPPEFVVITLSGSAPVP